MKLLHIGDLHLGRSLNEFSLIEDQRYMLDQIAEIAAREQVQGILIAGDVYDKSIPSEEAVNLLDAFLNQLAGLGIEVYMISGNHDSDDRLEYGSRLFERSGIHIAGVYDGRVRCFSPCDEYGPLHIWLLPFVKASTVKHYHPEAEIANYDQAVKAALADLKLNPAERNVMVAHQFVIGTRSPELGGSENASVAAVGDVEMIHADTFAAFDYVALGHIHSPQKVGRETVRYCGSMLKYSLSEISNHKSVPLITFGEAGKEPEVKLIPLSPLREMRHLTGPMKELLNPEHVENPGDYIYATLTDEDTILDAISALRNAYPNILKLDYKNSHSRETGDTEFNLVTEEKTFEEVISEFYEMQYGCPISERELAIMKELAEEAGISE